MIHDDTPTLDVAISEHARDQFLKRADALHITPTLEAAWRQSHPIDGGDWLNGERARFDPTNRLVFPVRDGTIRTAIRTETAKPAIQNAVRDAGWHP